jgi:hypothetical protein
MREIVLLLGTLALTDCTASPQSVYLRTDGQDVASNPALREQLDRDRKACEGDEDDKACMAVKGYVSVSPDRAVSKQQQLAAIAAQNAEIKTSFPRTPKIRPIRPRSHRKIDCRAADRRPPKFDRHQTFERFRAQQLFEA